MILFKYGMKSPAEFKPTVLSHPYAPTRPLSWLLKITSGFDMNEAFSSSYEAVHAVPAEQSYITQG